MSLADVSAESDSNRPPAERNSGTAPIRYGFAFAVVACLLLLQPLCTSSYIKLFYEKSPSLIQPVPAPGMPVPHAIAWSPRTVNFISQLGGLPMAAVLGWNIVLCSLFVYGLFRILNPTFRMTTGVDWDSTLLSKTYMHTRPVIKAYLIGVSAFLPLMLLWFVVGWIFGQGLFSLAVRLILIGAAVWVLFSRDGVAGDYESGGYGLPRGRDFGSLAARGAIAGAVAALTVAYGPCDPVERLFAFYRSLGGIGEGRWWAITVGSLTLAAGLGLAWGWILVGLGRPKLRSTDRARRAAPGVIALLLLCLLWNRWLPAYLADNFDYQQNEANREAITAARKMTLAPGDKAIRRFLVLSGSDAKSVAVAPTNLLAEYDSAENAAKMNAYLRERSYRTALIGPALGALAEHAMLDWDVEEQLRIILLEMEKGGDSSGVPRMLHRLSACAATAGVVTLGKRFASDDFVQYPDRASAVEVGDAFAKLGDRSEAERLYRKANLPESQVIERAMERTKFAAGVVRGKVQLDGKPAGGMKVGLLPLSAMAELEAASFSGRPIAPAYIQDIAEAVRADSSGEFELTRLTAGSYYLLLELPSTEDAASRESMTLVGAPIVVTVGYAQQKVDLGTIGIHREK